MNRIDVDEVTLEIATSKIDIFVQVQGTPGVIAVELPTEATHDEIKTCLSSMGVEFDGDTHIFLDESTEPIAMKCEGQVEGLKQGGRLHVCRSRKVVVKVYYLENGVEEEFPPGVRIRKVKTWAVHYFKLDKQDAAEHVLRLCDSTQQPASDTPLNELIDKATDSVCFDLVPEKRVEG